MKRIPLFLVLLTLAGTAAADPNPLETPSEKIQFIDEVVKKGSPDSATIQKLAAWMKSDSNSIPVRENAAWALGQLDARSQVDALVDAARSKSLLLRSAALNALIRMRARTGLPVYIEISKGDPALNLRQRAIIAMGLLRWEKTIEPLVTLAQDELEEIRGAATLAMAATHSTANDFRDALTQMASDKSPYVQSRAKKGLDVANRDTPAVRKHLKSSDPDIRLFAGLYFHYHGSPADIPVLNEALKSEKDDQTEYELNQAILGIQRRAEEKAQTPAPPKTQPN